MSKIKKNKISLRSKVKKVKRVVEHYIDRHRYYGKKIQKQKHIQLFYTVVRTKKKKISNWQKFEQQIFKDDNYQHLKTICTQIFYIQ